MLSKDGRLNFLGVLRISGADAVSFLQGQLSNDMRRLASSHCLLAAYSNVQGRVISLLRLAPHSSGILAILPREMIAAVRDQLKRFVMRSKVQVEDASDDIAVAGAFGPEALTAVGLTLPATADGYSESDFIGLARLQGEPERYWVLCSPARLAGMGLDTLEDAWRLADITAGLPQVYAATRELFVAQMLNLDLLDGISFTKGCYTGQEIIARTQHLGRIKRRMFLLRLPPGHYAVGDALTLQDGRTARLVDVIASAASIAALAVLPLEASAAGEGSGAGSPTRVAATVSAPPYLVTAEAP